MRHIFKLKKSPGQLGMAESGSNMLVFDFLILINYLAIIRRKLAFTY